MSKRLVLIGIVSAVLWQIITWISKGIPREICHFLDSVTGEMASREINQMAYGFYYQVNNNDMPTIIFLGIYCVLFLLMFLALRMVEKRSAKKHALGIVVLFSILFRILVWPSEPIHENDFYRYLWDGKSAVAGINPFKYAPSDLFMIEEGFEEEYFDEAEDVWLKVHPSSTADIKRLGTLIKLRDQNPLLYERIGHWQVPTIYPPVGQIVFALRNVPLIVPEIFDLPILRR